MIYNIGQEGSPYQELGDIQWNSLQAGDVVNVHWRAEPYTERLLLNAQGTEDLPIVIQGVPGPNGELPVLSSVDATTPEQFSNFNLEYRQELGGSIYIGPPGSYPDADEIPEHITIRGFEITGAGQGNGFTDTGGIYHDYPGSAGVYVKGGDNITIADNYIHHNGMGVFSNSNHDFEITENLVIDGNVFEENGLTNSYLRHHVYTEGVNTTVSNNVFGDKIAGDEGSLLKMRDVGVTVTGNTFGSSPGHIIDLGDVQSDAMVQAGYNTSDAFHHDNTITGNIINATTGNIYLGGDSLGKDGGITSETYRKSVDFNDNTIHYESDQADLWRLGILRAPSTDQTFNISGNEITVSSSTPGEQESNFALLADGGNLNVTGPNTLSTTIAQRAANTTQEGEVTGWEYIIFVDAEPDPDTSLTGDEGNNTLIGTAENNLLQGLGGDDWLDGRSGDDRQFGGEGNDTIVYDAVDDFEFVQGGEGFDTLFFIGTTVDVDLAANGFERTQLYTTDTASEEWNTRVETFGADDRLIDSYTTFDDGTAQYSFFDTYNTRAWAELQQTFDASGNMIDQVFVADQNTGLVYDGSSNYMPGTEAGETLDGTGSGDSIYAFGGNDILNGNANHDWLDGGLGVDRMFGGTGNDTIVFDAADDLQFVDGGDGFDILFFYNTWQDIDLAAHNFEVSQLHRVDSGSEDWTSITETFDADNLLYDRYTVLDDGTATYQIFDSHDAMPWSELQQSFDTSGNLIDQVFV